MIEKTVDADALAEILDISKEKVYRMARAGEIPALRIGSVWRFDPSQVKQTLAQPRDPWKQSAASRSRRRIA